MTGLSTLKPKFAPSVALVLMFAVLANGFGPARAVSAPVARARAGVEKKRASAASKARTKNEGAHAATPSRGAVSEDVRSGVSEAYGKLPLRFEANVGQTGEGIQYLAKGGGYSLFLTPSESFIVLDGPARAGGGRSGNGSAAAIRTKLVGANPRPKVSGLDELPGKSNYFIGNDPDKWRANVSAYARVKYEGVYPGVDLVYYGNQRQLEHDFVVAPGADPASIKLAFEGANNLRLDREGNLLLRLKAGEVRQSKPVAYQEDADGLRREVPSRYVRAGRMQVAFVLGQYDATRPLIIDPVLSYSTYLGGTGGERGTGVAVDSAGDAYLTGFTSSTDFSTPGVVQPAHGGGPASGPYDAFVMKMNAAGTALVYATYLGGNGDDRGNAIAVDSSGNAYVTGITPSSNFPVANAFQSSGGGSNDAFITKLNPTGSSLVYSSYFGGSGSDEGRGVAVDSSGSAYITGVTRAGVPTANAFQAVKGSLNDAFITKFAASGASLLYSTYLGGNSNDEGNAIAVDSSGDAYVTGYTESTNFPRVAALQTASGGSGDAFVTKFNSTGTSPVYSTYLGGGGSDFGYAVAADSSGNAYVAGSTSSTNFPTANAFQTSSAGQKDCFVTKYNPSGAAHVYSTYLGGTGDDEARGVGVDALGDVYLAGKTTSFDFPTIDSSANGAGSRAFVTKFAESADSLVYSIYLDGSEGDGAYGIAVDSEGSAYITGDTSSTDFPTSNPLQQLSGTSDVFLTKIEGNPTFMISGRVLDGGGNGISGATVSVSGTQSATTQTDADGFYTVADLASGGDYTVIPSKSPYTFVPESLDIDDLTQDATADFSALTYTVSGRLADAAGNGVEEATVTATGLQDASAETDEAGHYSLTLSAGGDYTITPSKVDPVLTYTFAPASQDIGALDGDTSLDFTYSAKTVSEMFPVADAHVRDGASAGANFGTADTLEVKTDATTNTGNNRDAYFKFDLTGVASNITSAKLRVNAALSAAGSVETSAYGVSNSNWVESGPGGITWNNRPALGAAALTGATATVNSTDYATYDIDVTNYVRNEKAAGRDVVSLALHNPSASAVNIDITAREANDEPLLVVTTDASHNASPSVSINAPANGASLTAPANVTVTASAADSDGTVSKVEFFAGTSSIGVANASPFQVSWSNVAAGSYTLTAVATDDRQASTSSSPVVINVIPANVAPAVTLNAPLGGTNHPAGSNIALSASASDTDGTISKVEFFDGATLVGTATTPAQSGAYEVTWNGAQAGAHSLTAKATDNAGAVATTSAVNVTVVGQTGLSPTADAYVRDGTSANTNFGTAAELQTQLSATTGNSRESYMKFDLATVSGIHKAKLRLYGRLIGASGRVSASVYPVATTSWTESGITWNNKPAAGASPLDAQAIPDDNARWYEWDVTAYMQSEKAAGHDVVSFVVKNGAVSPYLTLNSKEATTGRPQLLLWTTQPLGALFVVGSATLGSGDSAAKTRLENLGYTVTVKAASDGTAVNASDADGKALVVISSTVTPENVADKFRNVPVPVVTWESELLDDEGMTWTPSATESGTAAGQTQVSISGAAHPMAAGLSGTVTVVTTAGSFTWGKPGAQAFKIATLTSDSSKAAVFGYDGGAAMPGLDAPSRRVALFLTDTTAGALTANGGSLFDAAVRWAGGFAAGPTITSLTPSSGVAGVSVTITGANFGATRGDSTVSFNGAQASTTSWGDGSIVATVPANATTGPVVVTVSGVASNGVTFTLGGPTDSDGDGLPDDWELNYFGDLDHGADEDADEDGLTNLQEYLLGLNPTGRGGTLPDDGYSINLKLYTPLLPQP